jgi:hypothetical protein
MSGLIGTGQSPSPLPRRAHEAELRRDAASAPTFFMTTELLQLIARYGLASSSLQVWCGLMLGARSTRELMEVTGIRSERQVRKGMQELRVRGIVDYRQCGAGSYATVEFLK